MVTTPPIENVTAAADNEGENVLTIVIVASTVAPGTLIILCLIAGFVLVARAKIGQKRVTARKNTYVDYEGESGFCALMDQSYHRGNTESYKHRNQY